MAYFDTTWYCNAGDQATTGYYAVPKRAQNAAVVAGQLCRQFTTPAVGVERVYVCIIGGTTANTTDATWGAGNRGSVVTDGTATWEECTGAAAVNGDATNVLTWAAMRTISTAVTVGQIIKRNSGVSYQICRASGTVGASEPAFSDTAGTNTIDGSVSWQSIGPVSNFTGGQAPHARLANACATNWFAAGNTVYVGDNHAESQATAITIQPTLSQATMSRIICHNHSGSYPPVAANLATTATISTTAGVNLSFTPGIGSIYIYGLTFAAGVGSASPSNVVLGSGNSFYYFDSCIFKLATTFAGPYIDINAPGGGGSVVWNNCQVSFAIVSGLIHISHGGFVWQNTGQVLVSGSTVPNALISNRIAGYYSSTVLEALDLSQVTVVFGTGTFTTEGNWIVKDCKLNASATFATPAVAGHTIQYIRSDSAAKPYVSSRYAYEGTETTETSITRVGGASDPTGQVQSRKIVTTANAQWLRPFKAEPYAIWNATTGANVTVTVCGTVNAGALPNNDDIWLEVEYLGSSATPLGTIVTTTKSNVLAAGSAVAADSSTWNNTAAGYATWDPATVTAVTLSGGDLVATNTGTSSPDQGARVATASGKTSGKYYFELTLSATNSGVNLGAGIGTTSSTYTTMGGSATTGDVLYSSGNVWTNNVNSGVALGSLVSTGGLLGVAVDLDNRKIWFRIGAAGNWNANATYNPASNVGGVTIPAGTMVPFCTFGGTGGVSGGRSWTANFGASAFTGAVPSGFTAGWPLADLLTPFKLVATLSSPQPGMAGYIHARVRAAKPSTTYYIDPQITLS